MAEEQGQAPGDVEPDQRGTKQYCANFEGSGEKQARELAGLFRGLGARTLEAQRALFDNRASASAISNWKAGRRALPQWAVEMLQSRTAWLAERAAGMKAGPGSKAGRRNLRRGNWPR